eukprot:XP_020395102.1 PWI domain-containing protein C825.05c-like isoform X2 [Zea mays]
MVCRSAGPSLHMALVFYYYLGLHCYCFSGQIEAKEVYLAGLIMMYNSTMRSQTTWEGPSFQQMKMLSVGECVKLTGFMEKNTVKFMKELWSLLLSAQQNASGVPQQFLDEKEAEIHQKKDDRIAQEIQKKPEKEGMDSELEKNKTMDGDVGNSRSYGDPVASALNSTNFNIEEEKDNDFKRTSRPKNRL